MSVAYSLRLRRGLYFESPATLDPRPTDSPLREPLKAIGFDDASVTRILRKFKPQLIQVWADITLAAREKSPGFFKVGPQAYFMDNIEKAAQGTRTPPDWWYEHRKAESRRERETKRSVLNLPPESEPANNEDEAFQEYLLGEGRDAFSEILTKLAREFSASGQTPREAEQNATEAARTHLRSRFRRFHQFLHYDPFWNLLFKDERSGTDPAVRGSEEDQAPVDGAPFRPRAFAESGSYRSHEKAILLCF